MMKKMKFIFLMLMMLACANVFSQTADVVTKAMGPGFNLGNVWENGVNTISFASVKPIIDKYKAAGMKNVRIPTTWMNGVNGNTLADGNGNLITTNSRLTELKNTIDYCLAQGLYVTLNTHHESWLKDNYNGTAYYDDKFANLWKNIANYFKSYPSTLVFEILNEPEGKFGKWGGEVSPMDENAQALTRQIMKVGYDAIRATGGNNVTRIVQVSPNGQGNHDQIDNVYPALSDLPGGGADKYLAMHVHSYDPWDFCGHTGHNTSFPGLQTFIADVTNTYNWAQTKLGGIPVHYGEFGVGRAPDQGGGPQSERSAQNVLDYYKTMAENMIGKNMTFSVWDDRGWFALIDNGGTTFTYNIVPYMMTNIKNIVPVTPVLTTITVTPATTTLAVGQTAQFAAAGKDQTGAAMTMTPTWTVTGGGTISTSGLFTATTTGGPFTVKATSGTISGTAAVTVTAPVAPTAIPGKVEAESYSAYNNTEAAQMLVATTDGGNKMGYNSVGDWYDYNVNVATAGTYTVDFRVSNGAVAAGQFQLLKGTAVLATVDVAPTGGWENFVTLTKTVTLTAGVQTLRIYTVVAGVDYNWVNFTQAVTPVLTSITISTSPATTTAGTAATFAAQGKDQFGANIAATITWSVSAGATISAAGVFSSTTTGTYTVTATSGTVTKTAQISVTAGALGAITLTPATATIASGATQQYTVSGKDAYNNVVTVIPTWAVSGGGTISAAGLFTATTVGGPFTVTASSGTISGTAQVSVTAGALSIITLTPATATIASGATQQYTAVGKDANNNAVAITPTWTVTGGGTISAGGLFTATTAGGPFTVKATSGTVSGTATVTVTATVASIAIPGTLQAEDYTAYNNAEATQMRVVTTDGGTKMGYNSVGDWYDYSVNVATAGNYTLTFRVSNGAVAAGQFQLLKGAAVLTTVDVAPTGGWENFVTLTKTVTLTAGTQTLRINTVIAGVDYNWVTFTQVATPVLTTITVTPASSTLTVGQTAQFAAAGKDQNGAAITMTPTWTVTGGGTISASGLFTATTAGGPFTVKAASGTVSGTAAVTVTAAAAGIAIPGTVQAEDYSAYNNAQPTQMRVATTDGGIKMGYNDAGDWYDYSVNVATAGNYTITFRVANGSAAAGQLQLLKGAAVLTTVDVTPTGGWENFVTLTKTVAFTAGVQTIRLNVVTAGVDINWFAAVLATNPVVNSVAFNPPMVVESGDTYVIPVTYSSTTANDVNVGFYTAAWGYVAGQTQTVAAGSGVLNFTITIPAATAVGTTYTWQTQIMPVGGTYLQRYAVVEKFNVQVTNLKSATVGINDHSFGNEISIYPVPVTSMLNLKGVENVQKISVYNSVGQLLKQYQKGNETLFNIDVNELKSGIYFVELRNEKEKFSKKIIKR